MLQPATKALAQVLAGRAGASGQLGHARTMLAQAERMIAERTHNRLTPAEREEFFEQLARLKLTLADADVEAEVRAVEDSEPRPQAPPVAQERLKEMALALSVRERPSQSPSADPVPDAEQASVRGAGAAPLDASAQAESHQKHDPQAPDPALGAAAPDPGAAVPGRLMLPKLTADQAAQAVAFGGMARRRSRASSRAATAAAVAAAEDETAARTARAQAAAAEAAGPRPTDRRVDEPSADQAAAMPESIGMPRHAERHRPLEAEREADDGGAYDNGEAQGHEGREGNGVAVEAETKPRAKASRRVRKPKHQGLPEGWVIDEEGFVVPGAD